METQVASNAPLSMSSILGPRPSSSYSSSTGLSLFSNNPFRRSVSSVVEDKSAPHQRQEIAARGSESEEVDGKNHHVRQETQSQAQAQAEAGGSKEKEKKSKKKKKKKHSTSQKLPDSPATGELEAGPITAKGFLGKRLETERNGSRDESVSANENVDEVILDREFEQGKKAQNSGSASKTFDGKKVKLGSHELALSEKDEIERLSNIKSEGADPFLQKSQIKKPKNNHAAQTVEENKQTEGNVENSGDKIVVSIQGKEKKPRTKIGTKRKKEETIETRYERRMRGGEEDDGKPLSIKDEEGIEKDKKKRKNDADDEDSKNDLERKQFDDDQKLKRTIFVGNLPLNVKKKALIKEFSQYGPVESARLRSIPLLDSKIPRKGAIMKGQINEAVNSQHAYIVFGQISHANDALAHNMKEFNGNHIRVDAAHAPNGKVDGKDTLSYDHTRSAFVGNLPFDVKDEELYQIFTPESNVEAVRVIRDPHTSLGKGFAFVLFKTKEAALRILSSKKKTRLRDRILRITRVFQKGKEKSAPPKKVKTEKDDTSSQRKRTKLSASYEGVRASKEVKQDKKIGEAKLIKRASGQAGKRLNSAKKRVKNRGGMKKLKGMQ